MIATNVVGAVLVLCRTLALSLDGDGRAVSLRHRESGYEFLSAAQHPAGLWQLGLIRPVTYRDPLPPVRVPAVPYAGHEWFANHDEYRADLVIDSDTLPAPEVRGSEERATLAWRFALPDGAGEGRFTLAIEGGDRDDLVFRATVRLPRGWAVKRATYPCIRGFGDPAAPDADALLYPESWGVLRRNPLADMTGYSGQYPGPANWCQMAAWLHGEHGVYVGVRDPDSTHTGIDVQYVEGAQPAPLETDRRLLVAEGPLAAPGPRLPLAERLAAGRAPAMQLRCHHWPAMTGRWRSPYAVTLQGFTGDWYEAARIHRAWATRQRWCRRGPLAERDDAPAGLANTDLWFMKFGFPASASEPQPAAAILPAMDRLREFFGMPFGLHWYNWHAFSWHRNFPSHSPAVPGFSDAVKTLQAQGIVVMPYCQGRLLYRDRAAFAEERAHASIGSGGQPRLEQYTAADDWPLALCPEDDWSRRQWREAARSLWEDHGVDGVYFDQISGMPPSLCYHAAHRHKPGGGDHGWRGYDRLLAALDELKEDRPGRFIASELMADAYLDRIDLYLSFVPALEDFVPLYAAIYGDYATVMGRATPAGVLADPQRLAMSQGEQLLFGGQLGWTGDEILRYPAAACYLRDLARLRARVRPFLHGGRLMPPLHVVQSGRIECWLPPELTMKTRPVRIERPAVRHTAWERPGAGWLVLLLNENTESAAVRVTLPAAAPADGWRLVRLGAESAAEPLAPVAGEAALTLSGLEALALVNAPPTAR